MAKKNESTEVAKVEEKAVAKVGAVLPPALKPSAELEARIAEVDDNLASVDNFRLPRIKMTSHGAQVIAEQDPVMSLENVVILHTKKTNVYYDKPYNPSKLEAPTCFSLDGNKPDPSIAKPVHTTCKGCPMAEFGTNSMKSGKACRNLKPMFLLLSDQALMPRQLTVSPTGLKAANQYLMDLTEQGLNYRRVLTKVEFYKANAQDTYVKVKFKTTGKVPVERQGDIEFLRSKWLPIMNNQNIDQSELASEQSQPSGPVDTKGEY